MKEIYQQTVEEVAVLRVEAEDGLVEYHVGRAHREGQREAEDACVAGREALTFFLSGSSKRFATASA